MTFVEWWRTTSRYVKFFLGFAVAIVTLSSATTAWIALGLFVPASRDYVRHEVALIAVPVLGLAIEQRNRLRRNRDDLISRKAVATDDQRKVDLIALIEQADQDIMEIEARIAALEKLRME